MLDVSRYLAITSVVFLSACDFTAGLTHVYRLDELPLPVCVEDTLKHVEGVTDVSYAPDEVNRRALHRFSYRAEGVEVRLDIDRNRTRPEYVQSYMVLNAVPPSELIARLRPVMTRVDQALESNCGVRGLSQGVEEYCPRGLFRPKNCKP
jgi:hypothetical protein